jgi:hypothetical protein
MADNRVPAEARLPETPGFGNCQRCPLRDTGTALLCYRCAAQTLATPGPGSCPVCSQQVSGDKCTSTLCASPDRKFDRSTAIAMKTGELEWAILRWKDRGAFGWRIIFGRVLAGFLREHVAAGSVDLLPANHGGLQPRQPSGPAHNHRLHGSDQVVSRPAGSGGSQFGLRMEPGGAVSSRPRTPWTE